MADMVGQKTLVKDIMSTLLLLPFHNAPSTMTTAPRILSNVALGLASAAGLYAVLLGVLLTPSAQRFALYAHKFNTLFFRDIHDGELFGFSKNQATPFNIKTPDGETLYAWHILPLDQYARHEKVIRDENRTYEGPLDDFTSTTAFKLLTSDNPSPPRVVVSFHGNAGHVAEGTRPAANRYITSRPNTHLLTIDYRGFGHSTGSPTESGLIIDGIALVDWVMNVANIPPERILILGQSLGTAVSSAVALHYADPLNDLLPIETRATGSKSHIREVAPTTFAGVVLAAPFNSIPTLLLTYRIGGLLPLLLPLRPVPWLANILTAQMIDKWPTAERLTAYYRGLEGSAKLRSGSRSMGSIQVVHAINDADIPHFQTEMICRRMLGQRDARSELNKDEIEARECINGSEGAAVLDVKRDGFPRLRFELVNHGGHNRIITYSPVAVAVARAFDDLFE